MKKIYILLAFILLDISASAQREVEVEGTSVLVMEEDMTLGEAKKKVIENAKVEAIKSEFGTMVVNNVLIHTNDNNGNTNSGYSESTLEVAKGDWLGDTAPAAISVSFTGGKLILTATVKGIAREILHAKTQIEWNTLNKPNLNGITTTFNNGDNIYVSFRSPRNGYVALYLIGPDGKAYCLLPYAATSNGQYSVIANKQYLFFDSESDMESNKKYRMTTNMNVENNDVILIFSPNPFNKTYDRKETSRLPNSVSGMEFQQWILKCQQSDRDMIVSKKSVKIINNK